MPWFEANKTFVLTPEQQKVGNYLCESCEEDRKLAEVSAELIKDEPCWDVYKDVESCMKNNNNQASICSDLWKKYAQCRQTSNNKT